MFNSNLLIMNANLRLEEVAPMGDFVKTSYTRDFDAIKAKFPKMDEAFRTAFFEKLEFVKELESSLELTESQKGVTASLYAEADALNEELNFLSAYFDDAGLNKGIITDLKTDLFNGNIEGALLKIEGVKQFVTVHQAALVAEGMDGNYADKLRDYKVSMTAKNALQNEIMDNRKQLTERNIGHYEALKKMIRKIMRNGKLVFANSVVKDEYTSSKVVQRMRAARAKG